MDVIKKKHWWQSDQLKWSVIGLLGLLVGYLVVLMYVQGEYLFAIMTLILSSAGLYIFANRKTYAWRYVYPGLAGMGLFVLFPLVCTIAIAFTNYSSTNQLTFERAQQVLMDRSYQAGKTYNFGLYPTGDEWQLALTDGETGKHYLSDAFSFGGEQKLQLKETDALPGGERANLRIITQNRLALNQITAVLPDESKVIMSSLRQFSGTRPLYTLADDGLLTNNQSGVKYRPNNDRVIISRSTPTEAGVMKNSVLVIPLLSARKTLRASLPTKGSRSPFSLSSSGPWSFRSSLWC